MRALTPSLVGLSLVNFQVPVFRVCYQSLQGGTFNLGAPVYFLPEWNVSIRPPCLAVFDRSRDLSPTAECITRLIYSPGHFLPAFAPLRQGVLSALTCPGSDDRYVCAAVWLVNLLLLFFSSRAIDRAARARLTLAHTHTGGLIMITVIMIIINNQVRA